MNTLSVGQLLQEYRKGQHFSQLALATEAEVSSRHISFIETGRSHPSRQILLALAETLKLPHRDTNLLMKAGGYSAQYQHSSLDSEGMCLVKEALTVMLKNHNPLPSVVIDKDWNMLMMNDAYQQILSLVMGDDAGDKNEFNNVLRLLLAPNGLRTVLDNWEELACHLLRLRAREETISPAQEGSLLQSLLCYPDLPNWKHFEESANEQAMLLVNLNVNGLKLNLFSTIATFGTAADVTLQELRIESYFPADDETAEFFKSLAD